MGEPVSERDEKHIADERERHFMLAERRAAKAFVSGGHAARMTALAPIGFRQSAAIAAESQIAGRRFSVNYDEFSRISRPHSVSSRTIDSV